MMKRLFALLLLLALLVPLAPAMPNADTAHTDKAVNYVYPYQPHINVTRVIDLSNAYLANVSDTIVINSTKEFNAFTFAIPSFAFDVSVSAENASASLIAGKTYVVNGTEMKRFTVILDRNVTFANITVKFYFFDAFVNETRHGEKPSEYNVFAIVRFTTVPISKYVYDYVRLNVTFPSHTKPRSDLSLPANGSVSLSTIYRKFENYTATAPGLDLVAIAESEPLPYVVTHASVTYQFTSGSEVYVKREMDFVVTGTYPYDGPFTSDQPKSAIRMLYVYLPKDIDEVKFYDDLGVLVNVTKYPRGDYRRREIRTRTPLVGNISTYHLTFYYKIHVPMGIKVDLQTRIPYVEALIEKLDVRIISPPFGAIGSVKRLMKPETYISTGSRHMPVVIAETEAYNVTKDLEIEIVAYRSLMSYIGLPILGAILTLIVALLTLFLISLVPEPEKEEVELPKDVKRAIELLEEVASIGPLVINVLEKPMRPEERIKVLENIRSTAEAKLREAIAAVYRVEDKDIREILIAIAGVGAAIISGIRRLEDIERMRPNVTRAVYTAAIAEAAAFIDSSYRRMMAMLVNLKL